MVLDHYGLLDRELAVNTIMVHMIQMADDAQMKIRLPQSLKDQIEASAAAGSRSLNAEIVFRLEGSFPDMVWDDNARARRATKRTSEQREIENLRTELRAEEVQRVELEKKIREILLRLDALEGE